MEKDKSSQQSDKVSIHSTSHAKNPNAIDFGDWDPDEANKKCNELTLLKWATYALGMMHPTVSYGLYMVIPYYVLENPQYGWGVSDLSIFFSAVSVGEIASAQVVAVSAVFDSNKMLFFGHLIQIISGLLGYLFISNAFGFNYWLFALGCFGAGFSFGVGCVQVQSILFIFIFIFL